ncbi:MAG: UPF0149 family protein [Rhodocyclales bacterium]|nr:UPF0149 family protein [Rhodocyclales bacterium]
MNMNADAAHPFELSDDEFDALEELLTSEVVPDDCMNLEMLDGYLAAVVASPVVIASTRWLPHIWTAHGDEVDFVAGHRMQRVIRLVLCYYNELATTIGAPDGWEPFWYGGSDGEEFETGEEWIEGFAQGLELWPADWGSGVPEADAAAVRIELETLMEPWKDGSVAGADEQARLEWLERARVAVCAIASRWRSLGLASPEPLVVEEPGLRRVSTPGRNDPCPCGSGKKYKKCCGAE